ncbi:MAG: prolipoprotein diacylglyceryl transferase [Chloroflexota bacterium]|nr:prolipoprotein diacylglyceryl transferase [Chloroflexota bacterium]
MEFLSEYIQFTIGDRELQIRYYGIIIVAAMLVAAWLAARLAKRDGRDPDHVWGALTWAIIPAIIGARLWFVLFPPADLVAQGRDTAWFLANFFNTTDGAIAIWSGGLSIFGAVFGGLLGAYLYLRRNRLPVPAWLDIAGVALPLGQAIGRWANFINQELYGAPTSLPWGIAIDSANRVAPYNSLVNYPIETRFHPLFLYESLWSFLAFIVLLLIFTRYRDRLRFGDIFLLFVMQYSVIRFLLEFIRVEVTLVGGVNWSQVVTAVLFIVALVIFVARRRAPTVAEARESMRDPIVPVKAA